MKSVVNRRVGSSLLSASFGLLGACASLPNDEVPVRAQAQSLHVCEEGIEAGPAAVLRDVNGVAMGRVTFASDEGSTVVIVAAELPPEQAGIHGFHIHANDDPSNGEGCVADPEQPATTHFASVDGHFNPEGAGHTHGHHMGDMPALFFMSNGVASMRFVTDRFVAEDMIGRAVILHAGADNYGNVPVGENPDQYSPNDTAATELTAKTGNAGARIACGVIE